MATISHRRAEGTSGEERARDLRDLNLVRAAVDLEDLRVARELLDLELGHVAVAAEQLDGFERDFDRRSGAELFGLPEDVMRGHEDVLEEELTGRRRMQPHFL